MRVSVFRPLLVAAFVVGGGSAAFAHGGGGGGMGMHSFSASHAFGTHQMTAMPSAHQAVAPSGQQLIDPPEFGSLVGIPSASPNVPLAGIASEEAATRVPVPPVSTIDPALGDNDVVTQINPGDISGATTLSLPGSTAGAQVPVYNAGQNSTPGLSQSINQASQDSGATACNGLGQRNSTIGAGSSSQLDGCSAGGSLSTMSIMSTSGIGRPINVGTP